MINGPAINRAPWQSRCLEHVQDKMVARVKAALAWVVVVPLFVVDRDSHLRRIPMVHAIAATVVLLTVEILWVVNIRVVIEAVPVAGSRLATPGSSVSTLVCRCGVGNRDVAAGKHGSNQKMAEHQVVPPRDVQRNLRGIELCFRIPRRIAGPDFQRVKSLTDSGPWAIASLVDFAPELVSDDGVPSLSAHSIPSVESFRSGF